MLILATFICNLPAINLFADVPQITSADFEDQNLYNCLLMSPYVQNGILERDTFKELNGSFDLSSVKVGVTFTSFKGLEKFNLNSLTEIDLSGHSVTSVDNLFVNMPNLKNLDLSYNKLTQVDLTNLVNLTKIDLGGNYFTSFDDIVLYDRAISTDPSVDTIYCDVFLNYNQLDIAAVPQTSTNRYKLGVQGIKDGLSVYSSAEVRFSPYDSISSITIYDEGNQVVTTLPYDNGENLVYSTTLSYGNYLIKSSYTNQNDLYVNDVDFSVEVPLPTYQFVKNGEAIDQVYKTNEVITINFNKIDGANLVIFVNNENFAGSSLTIDKAGSYYITFYQTIGEHQSESRTFSVVCNINANLQWIYILVGILIFVIAISLVMIYLKRPIKGNLQSKEKF